MVAGLSHHPRIHLPIIAFPSSRTKKGPKMRKIILPLAALLLLAGCATRQRVDVGFRGGPGVYDGYYDGYYGGFNDGYWGNDGFFWYSGRDQVWHLDEDRHFRREGGSGFNPVHGHRGGDRDH
jgi:hypothetical protein